jgi:hypothetical protein
MKCCTVQEGLWWLCVGTKDSSWEEEGGGGGLRRRRVPEVCETASSTLWLVLLLPPLEFSMPPLIGDNNLRLCRDCTYTRENYPPPKIM